MLAFFLDISRSEIAESYHNSMLYILRNTQIISKMAVPISVSSGMSEASPSILLVEIYIGAAIRQNSTEIP